MTLTTFPKFKTLEKLAIKINYFFSVQNYSNILKKIYDIVIFQIFLYFCTLIIKIEKMETIGKTVEKTKKNQLSDRLKSKKLSKVGEWLNSGKSIGLFVDMRAVLR
jgi:hypothetical protein